VLLLYSIPDELYSLEVVSLCKGVEHKGLGSVFGVVEDYS